MSTSDFELQFHGKTYAVSRRSVVDLLDQRNLSAATSYTVESSVPVAVFEAFVGALRTQRRVSVTKDNADSLSLLAKEFFDRGLLSECSFEILSSLRERVSALERQVEHQRLGDLNSRVEALERKLSKTEATRIEIPLRRDHPLEGIIDHLTRKYNRSVREKGLVTITSKSLDTDSNLEALAEVTSGSEFCSKDEPGQWVCWDFHEMRVRPTHYTMDGYWMKSWIFEGSVDGQDWTEIDQRNSPRDFRYGGTVTFRVAAPADWRFIRMTQRETNHEGNDLLALRAVEFFGTLFE
jgi:hypothetical protein